MSAPITIIVPAKNAATTIRAALVSARRELPAGSRILVRDDGSTDGTAEQVRLLRDPRIHVVEGNRSIGVAASLNELLAEVQTPLVARMDADDLVLPGRWRAEAAALAAGSDIAFTPVLNWWSGTPLIKPQRPEPVDAAVAPLLLLVDNPFMHPTMLARTDTLRTLGGYRSVPSEDYDLWLRAATKGLRLTRLRVPRLLYRRHAGQVTAQESWRRSRAANPAVEEAFHALAESVLGFRPTWFAWRRDGFPSDSVPGGLHSELDALAAATGRHPRSAARPVLRRITQLRRHAGGMR